jgi:hypothetical protein
MALGRFRRLEPGGQQSDIAVQRLLRAEAFSRLAVVTTAASSRAGRTVHDIQDYIGNRFWASPEVESSDDEIVVNAGADKVARCGVEPKKGFSLGSLANSAGVSSTELSNAVLDLDGPAARKVIILTGWPRSW